jgi:hypothetical protein
MHRIFDSNRTKRLIRAQHPSVYRAMGEQRFMNGTAVGSETYVATVPNPWAVQSLNAE